MGKGFNNYMCKKFFHPGSIDNLKRVWMAQQKTDAELKKQEELKSQYDKEQELYNNKAMLAKGENKEKLSLNFMYEPPAGMKKEREREDGEPEFKFEWQRKFNAPRESYLAKDDDTIRDQPFGIQVRNVRCIKCKKWGHINTDKECELYTAPWELINPTTSTDPLELMRGMRDKGLALKAGVVEGTVPIPVHQLVASDEESEDETEEVKFIRSLSEKDKVRLLKKLEKLEKKKKRKHKKKKKKSKKSSSSSSEDEDSPRNKSHHKRKIKKENDMSDNVSSQSHPLTKDKNKSDCYKHEQSRKTTRRHCSTDSEDAYHQRRNRKEREEGRSHGHKREHTTRNKDEEKYNTHKIRKVEVKEHKHANHRENKNGSRK